VKVKGLSARSNITHQDAALEIEYRFYFERGAGQLSDFTYSYVAVILGLLPATAGH
jgi:hypothetical protein